VFCIECGEEIPDGAKFCPHCGFAQKIPNLTSKKKPVEPLSYLDDWGEADKPKLHPVTKPINNEISISDVSVTVILIVIGLLIAYVVIGGLSTGNDESDSISNGDSTTYISVSMYNNDDSRHPVHVYLNGEHVYGEWVEAGEMVWPVICPDRCPDGDYTVAIDWGGDSEYECTSLVKISNEGDRETVACNYHR